MSRKIVCSLATILGGLCLAATAWAQPPKEGSIAATGSENIRVQPTVLRLEVQLHGSGATAEKAVELLKAGRKLAMAKLKDLKAEEASIHFTNTALTRMANYGLYPSVPSTVPLPGGAFPAPAGGPPLLSPIPAAPSESVPEPAPTTLPPAFSYISAPGDTARPGGELAPPTTAPRASAPPSGFSVTPGYGPPTTTPPATGAAPATSSPASSPMPGPAVPPMYTPPGGYGKPTPYPFSVQFDAATTLHAEWRITTSDADGIALAGESLREKLIAARVFGEVNPPYPIVPGMTTPSPYCTPSYPAPTYARIGNGGFTLFFVGTLGDAQRKTALAAAVSKAQQRAAELAEIAGGRIGDLCSASSDISHAMTTDPSFAPSYTVISFPRADQAEVVSQSPNLPECTVQTILNYRLLSKNPASP